MNVSYADVFGVEHARHPGGDVRPGDLVHTGTNLHPQFRVVAIAGDKAWLRNTQTGAEGISPLDRCRRIGADAVAA